MIFDNESNDDDVMSEINMTPLVDVMLVLLIIFMITLPVITHSIKIDLPRAENSPSQLKPETISLSVNELNQVYWNDDEVNSDELQNRLAEVAAQLPQPEIQLRGARHVEYEHVVSVMNAVQKANIVKLSFVTEPNE